MERRKNGNIFMLLLLFAAVLCFTGAKADAAEYLDVGGCGSNLTYVLGNNGVLTITGEGDMTNFSDASAVPWFRYRSLISSVVFGGDVTSVGSYAFNYCVQLGQVTLPDSVKGIGAYAFYGCSNLTQFQVPPQVTGIGAYAFGGCSSLSAISLPDGLISIGVSAFSGCKNLGTIAIPESVTSIGKGAFENSGVDDSGIAFKRGSCGEGLKWELLGGRRLRIYGKGSMADYTSGAAPWYANAADITELEITDGVTGIGDFAFKGCTVIRSALVSNDVKRIGTSAFEGCVGLSGFPVGAGVTEISDHAFFQSGLTEVKLSNQGTALVGDEAFAECVSLKRVELAGGTLDLGSRVFSGCSRLEEVVLAASAKQVGSHMFSDCAALSSVVMGEGCGILGEAMFDGCAALAEVALPAGTEKLPDRVFENCTGLTEVVLPESVTEIGTGVFAGCSRLGRVVCPEGLKVIGREAFQNCTGLQSVVVPKGTERIGAGAFSGCSALKQITLPFVGSGLEAEAASAETLFGYIFGTAAYEGGTAVMQYFTTSGHCSYVLPDTLAEVTVTGGTLHDGAFDHCAGLRKISADGAAGMGNGVFGNCAGLEEVVLPEGITEIGAGVFRGCALLAEIVIPDSVTAIGKDAFRGCALLGGVTLPKELLSIGSGAFADCAALTDIPLPEQMNGIEEEAFRGCTKLSALDFPDRIVKIGKEAFADCTGLTSVSLPETMEEIGAGAFKGCTGIGSITFPGGITAVGEEVFSGCTALKSVTFADGTERIGKSAFSGCVLLEKITLPETVTEIGEQAFGGCAALPGIALPEGLIQIGSGAFKDCTGFLEIRVPDSVTAIGSGAFSGCSGLLKLTVPFVGGSADATAASGSTLFGFVFGTTAYKGGSAVRQYCSAGTVNTYYIPDSLAEAEVTGGRLFYGAFYGCTKLKSIRLASSESLTEIADCAFSDCTGLTEFSIPDSVTAIGTRAFSGCTGFTELTLPEGTERMGAYALNGCTGLTKVLLPESLLEIGSSAFANCSGLKEITVPDSVTVIGTAAFSGCGALESMKLPFIGGSKNPQAASAQTLFGYIFGTAGYTGGTAVKQYYSNSAATYYIPSSLKQAVITGGPVLYGAFYNCSGLESLTLPQDLTEIGNYAFRSCQGLKEISLPAGLAAIGSYAFMECASLTSVRIPEGTERIGSYAFRGCAALRECSLPQKLTELEPYTFSGCTSLESLTIPDQVTVIGTFAFQNCSGLSNLTVPDSVTEINIGAFSGCSGIERISLPFAGYSRNPSAASARTLFGFIFGGSKYEGGTATKQFYSASSSTYFIPDSLKYVEIRGGKLPYGTFYGCNRIVSILLPKDVEQIGTFAFCNCTALGEVTFSGTAPASIAQDAFTGVRASVFYPVSDATWAGYVGKQFGGTLSWEEHTHKYEAKVTPPTCTEQGYTTYRCAYCDSSYVVDYVSATGHTVVTDEAAPATCTENGRTEGQHCTVCGQVLTASKTIPATGHRFTGYVSNQDATYEKDGTQTAECANGCGTKDTRTETGSRLTDRNSPKIEIAMGENRWSTVAVQPEFVHRFQTAQTVTVTASDIEELPGGQTVNRLDKVYYYISETALSEPQLRTVNWTGYQTALRLNPDGRYLVYVKAQDRSGNLSYASTEGILIDRTPPAAEGITDGAVYCGKAEFTVTDLMLQSVTDNGTELRPAGGRYSIAGDGREHRIVMTDACGNAKTIVMTVKTGHDWGNPVFSWSKDYKSCTADFICNNDSSHIQKAGCTVKKETEEAGCVQAGKEIYTASVQWGGMQAADTKTVQHAALGHDYAVQFRWAEDKASCTAALTCKRPGCTADTPGHSINRQTCETEHQMTEASCVSEGRIEIVASVTIGGVTYKDIGSTETIPATGHDYAVQFQWAEDHASCTAAQICKRPGCTADTPGHSKNPQACTIEIRETEASCTSAGQREWIAKAVLDGVEYSESGGTEQIPAPGHDYEVQFQWSEDAASCTAMQICKRPGCTADTPGHTTDRQDCTVETRVTEATCVLEGRKETVASVIIDGTEYRETGNTQRLPVNDQNHVNTVLVGAKEATETEEGYTGDTRCEDCKKTIAYGEVIPAKGQPVDPDNPDKPVDPDNPDKPVDPDNPDNPVDPDNPDKPVDPDNPDKPVDPDHPDKPVDPDNPDQPADPDHPDQPANPDNPNQPGNSGGQNNPDNGSSGGTGQPAPQPALPKKGSKIRDSKGTVYTVTKAGAAVTYTASPGKKVKSVKIPETVKIDGISYKVTAIAKSACSGCRNLTSVTIGKNVKSIGAKAFYHCSALKKVTIKTSRLTAKNVGAKAFSDIHNRAVLKVPAKKLTAYRRLLKKKGIAGKTQTIQK